MVRLFFLCCIFTYIPYVAADPLLDRLAKPVPAPALGLPDLQNRIWKTESLKGQPAIINFWATWCPPCRAEMPSMERAWEQIKDEGIQMLAINYGEEIDTVDTFLLEFPMSIPVLLDTTGKTGNTWPFRALPTTFILDSEGNIVYQATGPREWDSKGILDKVRALKTNKTLVALTRKPVE